MATQWGLSPIPAPAPVAPLAAADAGFSFRWLVGWSGTWLILSGMSELSDSADLAAALAIAVAIGVSVIILPETVGQLRRLLA